MEFFKTNTWIWYPILAVFAWYMLFEVNKPCSSTVTYRIGTFDKRFNIPQDAFLGSVQKASTIWNDALGKKVFEYDPQGKLVINLTYDDRQKSTQENQTLEANIDKLNNAAQSVKAQYQTLIGGLNASKQEYTAMATAFNQEQKNYTDQVAYWNAHGGAPADTYATLNAQKDTLQQEQSVLEEKLQKINSSVDEINNFIDKYNLLVDTAETNVDTINSSAGKQFEQGDYDPKTNTINIFEFSTPLNLTRVLAHELGHALSLKHTSNRKSIMYPINRGENLKLSDEDIAEMKRACKL